MSKRFEVLFYGDVINCVRDETGKEYNLHELINLLMDQQATITHLEKVNGKNFAKRRLLEQDNLVLRNENKQLRKQIQNYEQLISNSYVGEEETLDGFVGKYVIWEDELQKYRKKNTKH